MPIRIDDSVHVARRTIFLSMVGLACCLLAAGTADAEGERRLVNPGDDLTKLAVEAPPGTAFVLAPGVYRIANAIHPKDDQTFEGNGNAVISGALVLTGFVKDGAVWRDSGPKPLALSYGGCDEERWKEPVDGCFYREGLFIDGKTVPRVFAAADVKGDAWFQDRSTGEIVVGFDPGRRAVELSYADTAFISNATGVVIRGLTIEKFTSLAQHGAIQGDTSKDWLVENNIIRENSGGGIRTGTGMRIVGNRVLANGESGILGGGDNMTVEGNEIAFNNSYGFSPRWEAGGTKFVRTKNLMVARNCVHHNGGTGLWTDIDNSDVVFVGNVAAYNGGVGIFQEIGGRSLIVDNVAVANGSIGDSAWSSQILVSGSVDATVWNNKVVVSADYGHGIFIAEEGRPNQSKALGDSPTYASSGNQVIGNEIRFLGQRGVYGFHAQGPAEPTPLSARNRFARNMIVAGDTQLQFTEQGAPEALSVAMANGQELGTQLKALDNKSLFPPGRIPANCSLR